MSEDYNTKKIVVRGFLRELSLTYENEDSSYVGDRTFPIIRGLGKEAKVYKNSRADAFRSEVGTRAPGGSAPIGETRATAVNLDPQNFAIARKITDELRQQARAAGNFPLKPDVDAVRWMLDQITMKREIEVSALIHGTDWSGAGVGGEDATGNWGDTTESSDTMVADLKDKEKLIVSQTGKRPNTLMLTAAAWYKICQSPFWLNKLNNTQFSGSIRPDQIAQTLNYEIIIASAVTNTAPESTDIDDFTSAWIMGSVGASNDKGHAFLFYKPPTVGLDTLSAGYQYRLIKEEGVDIAMTRWREPKFHSDMIDAEQEFDIAVMCAECGFLWKDTATT